MRTAFCEYLEMRQNGDDLAAAYIDFNQMALALFGDNSERSVSPSLIPYNFDNLDIELPAKTPLHTCIDCEISDRRPDLSLSETSGRR